MVELTPVRSSNIAAVGYDSSTTTLYIQFRNGRLYAYAGVPLEIYYALMAASSKGRYFYYRIRLRFRATRVR